MKPADILAKWDRVAEVLGRKPTPWIMLLRIAAAGPRGLRAGSLCQGSTVQMRSREKTLSKYARHGLITWTHDRSERGAKFVTITPKGMEFLGFTQPADECLSHAAGPDLHRPTLSAVRQRIIEIYEGLDALAKRCEQEEGGQEMAGNLREQAFGMRKVRMMLGRMLDEQAGHVPAYVHVKDFADKPAKTQAALGNLFAAVIEAYERGDLDRPTPPPPATPSPH